MKMFQKIVSMIAVSALALSMTVSASYTDVAKESNISGTVQTLSLLQILAGYDDGTFRPDDAITRAEFCAVVCRANGFEDIAQKAAKNAQESIFQDVPTDHWAFGYIYTAAGYKIVAGMGDGTFEPESNVTYEQAVKMLVTTLGYEPLATAKGGWPAGYLEVAKDYGVTKEINVADTESPATRATVAQLVYNALPVPLMEKTGPGSQSTFTIMDGYGELPYKALMTELGAGIIEGSVVGTAKEKYNQTACAEDEVIYRFNNAYKNAEWTEYIEKNADKSGYACDTFQVADGIDAAKYLNTPTVIYVKKLENGNNTIIGIMPVEEK